MNDPRAHAGKLQSDLDQVVREGQPSEPGFDARLVMKLDVEGIQPEDVESVHGLEVVSQEDKALLVLFASEEGLNEFTSRLQLLQQGGAPTRQEVLHAIKGIKALTPDDRTGPALRALGLGERETATLDIELWPVAHPSLLDAFSAWCQNAEVEILDHLRQPGIVLLRVRCRRDAVGRLLDHRDVRLADLPPKFKLERADLDLSEVDVPPVSSPPKDAPVLGILDSGLTTNHPLLGAAVADAQSYLERSDAEGGTGHGTAVAGLALYGDLHECSLSGQFIPRFWLASGRVLDDEDEYDDKLIENQLTEAVNDLIEQYGCRVFNLSIGDPRRPYARAGSLGGPRQLGAQPPRSVHRFGRQLQGYVDLRRRDAKVALGVP